MVRIICPKCKGSYLDNKEDLLICPSCQASFSVNNENLLLGAQYYTECDYDKANDCLMKYIVKNGAEPQAIFYKALCDGFCYDEDTFSLTDTYDKLSESLKELSEDLFPKYLALANDECAKLEKAVAQSHIRLLVDADAEKIKKEVSALINLQNDAKAFRVRLNALVNDYNDIASAKLSVKFSDCFLVDPELATQVGNLKFDKIAENVASHTVFTGILSTDIKNLEIYYRCIVMFFKKNRQKYDFLMASAEKFTELSKLLENGQYNTIKGTSAIGDKLKSAGYDFFQESLKDNDEDFETQTETVVILEVEVESDTEEEDVLEDISSTTDDIAEPEVTNEIASDDEIPEEAGENDTIDCADEAVEETAKNDAVIENTDSNELEEEPLPSQDSTAIEEHIDDEEIEEPAEESEIPENDQVAVTENNEAATELQIEEDNENDVVSIDEIEVISDAAAQETDGPVTEAVIKPVKRKKSYAPFVTVFLIIAGIIAIICITVIPAKINEKNYAAAGRLMADGKFADAVNVYAELGDYEDSEEKLKAAKYAYASLLEKAEKYEDAKELYTQLKNYEDSMAKVSSCTYNIALESLDNGKYDEAKELFKTIPDYADSKDKVFECDYQKGISYVSQKKYAEGIAIFEALENYSESKTKILDAKYKYVNEHLSKDDAVTLAYLEDLIEARYLDSVAVRRKLLGTSVSANGISTCLNYSKTDTVDDISEADKSKQIYYHITVTDPELYGKKLTARFTTSVGYTERKSFTLTEESNTFVVTYPATTISNYTVEFAVSAADGTELAKQTVTIK